MTQEKPFGTTEADYSERPFGFVMPDSETAMICEKDSSVQEKIGGALQKMGFLTVQPVSDKEALRQMRLHIFNVFFIDEAFNAGGWESNRVLHYLKNLNMSIRRKSFIVLLSATLTTMDYMEAYNKSVNLIINKRDIDGVEKILRQAMAEHQDFYRVFKEKIST